MENISVKPIEAFASFFATRGFHILPTGEVADKGNHRLRPVEVLGKYSEGLHDLGLPCTVTLTEVEEFVRANTPQEEKKPVFNLSQFIGEYLTQYATPGAKEQKWKISPDWKSIERLQGGIPVGSDITELIRAIRANAINKGLGKLAKADDIKCLVGDLAMRNSAAAVEHTAKKLLHDPRCARITDECLDKLHDIWQIKQSKEIHRTIIKHWMWVTKRKLLGYNASWPIWPNYMGGTAIGKSQYMLALTSPFSDFAITTSISKLLDDERQLNKLTSAYILNLDELAINERNTPYADREATLNKDQQATLKALLTQDKITSRVWGGQAQTTRRLTFSCISSANEHLYDIIYDEKTMRRYFEFECLVPKILDFSGLEEIKRHVEEMWRGVDERLENGYWNPECPVWDEVAEMQSKYYPTTTTTERWIKDFNIEACSKEDGANIQELYDEFKQYCKERGHAVKSQTKWLVDIKHLVPGSVGEDTHTYIRVKPKV